MRILIAGIGNMFLADDAFGVELAQRLDTHEFPDGVTVADYGISGMHLAYDLLTGYDTTILLDATPRGDKPGTVTVLELDAEHPFQGSQQAVDAHGMQPDAVIELLTLLGGKPGRMILVGCEPAEITDRIGLSIPVSAALDGAARAVIDLVDHELAVREGV
ncbi:MAG TPA: hydrogenase maturation protease [Pseudonocardiaceae bacterium]|jgi:hydrogenase maturation protease